MLIISFQAVGSNCMSLRQNSDSDKFWEKRSILRTNDELSDIFDFNHPIDGYLSGAMNTQPDSGSLTTTPFPRITIFDDHRDETLKSHISLALPVLNNIIELYVSILFIYYQSFIKFNVN